MAYLVMITPARKTLKTDDRKNYFTICSFEPTRFLNNSGYKRRKHRSGGVGFNYSVAWMQSDSK